MFTFIKNWFCRHFFLPNVKSAGSAHFNKLSLKRLFPNFMGGEGKKREMPVSGSCKHMGLCSTQCPPLTCHSSVAPSCSTQQKRTAKLTQALQLSLHFIRQLSVVLVCWVLLWSWRRRRRQLWERPQRGGRGLFRAGTLSWMWSCSARHLAKCPRCMSSPVTAAEHKQCCLSLKYLLRVGRTDTASCLEEKKCCELEQRCLRDWSALRCVWHCCPQSYAWFKSVTCPIARK